MNAYWKLSLKATEAPKNVSGIGCLKQGYNTKMTKIVILLA